MPSEFKCRYPWWIRLTDAIDKNVGGRQVGWGVRLIRSLVEQTTVVHNTCDDVTGSVVSPHTIAIYSSTVPSEPASTDVGDNKHLLIGR